MTNRSETGISLSEGPQVWSFLEKSCLGDIHRGAGELCSYIMQALKWLMQLGDIKTKKIGNVKE